MLVIRAATALDIGVIVSMWLSLMEERKYPYATYEERDANQFAVLISYQMANPQYGFVYVAINDGRIIGFISGEIKVAPHSFHAVVNYNWWYVAPQFRKGRAAKELAQKVSEWRPDIEYEEIHPAAERINVCEKHGYKLAYATMHKKREKK